MSASFQQAQQDGLCLRYPESLPSQRELTYDNAINLLVRAAHMATTVPFAWSYIDKPADGTLLLLFLPPNSPFPNDGIRYQEPEVKYTLPTAQRVSSLPHQPLEIPLTPTQEVEVHEIKCGFIPNSQDTSASRVRRRYRLLKTTGHQLVLVHYTRGPATPIPPALMSQPVRAYPLMPVNEPPVYVLGEKTGQKVYPGGVGPVGGGSSSVGVGMGGNPMHPGNPVQGGLPPSAMGMAVGGMSFTQQQAALLAQQNSTMESLERRRERERAAAAAAAVAQRPGPDPAVARPPQQRVVEDEDSGDEMDLFPTRTLAMARYKRNHDWMNDVFNQAAFGNVIQTDPKVRPYSIFSQSDIDEKTAKLQAEVEALQAKSAQRRAEYIRSMQSSIQEHTDMNMVGDTVPV
ncbi:SWI/SNF and RSC complexes subunit ssr4 [Psilocybe cubensis]|uniref:SWI/SNF and RSC complexes subunit ssr4 n=1 Tax=Psilocybe cubensis TaxID=181762 RepID=A0ACB8GXW3_PSICU|nr:SWI/SNF and RSC complexes subunit ssr4 [Psilocybe cubensis]KAH9480580.1 SWI/SNF and RSC complexes subunit ssr4 [Psilocybe cubensis]